MELWGGHECTLNRTGDRYLDQSVLSGHDQRLSDLSLFAELGLKALRYPVLWEKLGPGRDAPPDFTLSDARLGEIRRLGMRPIAGLCHHGGGPRWTNMLDDEGFARGLAAYARACAERYPWIGDWTPVNEPLTTARFSALYGVWHPHARSQAEFWRALLNEVDAVRLSMAEIRRVVPDARLVQTEDVGFCHATAPLRAQAAFENERRWATWDLLCGRVVPGHPLWERISAWGLEARLHAIADAPCPPDIIGVNHYLTSERLLDDRLGLYPPHCIGGDGTGPYANVEAVRTVTDGTLGIGTILEEAWTRYRRPIVVTECHNGCTREEQARWFDETWRTAQAVRDLGADIRAVTVWALLGAYDWDTLLTNHSGRYETGVFDLSIDGTPRPTAMVPLLKALARGEDPDLPFLAGRGWWRRPERFYRKVDALPPSPQRRVKVPARAGRAPPLLIIGRGAERIGALARACDRRDLAWTGVEPAHGEDDLAPRAEAAIAAHRPWAVVVVAARSAGEELVRLARSHGLRRAVWSDATAQAPEPGELVARSGASVSEAELAVFMEAASASLRVGESFQAASNRMAAPIYLPDAADAVLDLMEDGAAGEVALVGAEPSSWAELALVVAAEAGFDPALVEPVAIGGIRSLAGPGEPLTGAAKALPALPDAVRRRMVGCRVREGGPRCLPPLERAAAPETRPEKRLVGVA
jgi:dTDP-4-dehydrorhamnose reductase